MSGANNCCPTCGQRIIEKDPKKHCPDCGCPMIFYPSDNTKYCPDCKVTSKWKLSKGQVSTLIEGLTAENEGIK